MLQEQQLRNQEGKLGEEKAPDHNKAEVKLDGL